MQGQCPRGSAPPVHQPSAVPGCLHGRLPQRLAPHHLSRQPVPSSRAPPQRHAGRCCRVAATGDAETSAAPAPSSRDAGRAVYRPGSLAEIINDACEAVVAAVNDGETRLEVEFPVLPGDSYKGASDMYIDTNIQLALTAGKKISKQAQKKVHVLLPDVTEYKRAYRMFKSTLELSEGVSMGHLGENRQGLFGGLFNGGGEEGNNPKEAAAKADLFILVNASAVELVDLERYANEVVGPRALVLLNLELDTLRADLGLFGFPPKDLQWRFLSGFLPAFYIRPRDYSKTVAVAPFIINYSGCLLREYPGPWQVMLQQDDGAYACIAESRRRYRLGQVKEELMAAMGLNTEEQGSALAFLRRGYKTSTWWEDDVSKETSDKWRS